jgi:hypothetical protein
VARKPNQEQDSIVAMSRDRSVCISVAAGAGTGKTTTMVGVAEANPYTTILYVAYNASTKEEAKTRFPRNARVVTSHGLAYGSIGKHYRPRMDARQPKSRQAAELMGLPEELQFAFCVTCDQKVLPGTESALHASHAVVIERMQGWRIASLVKRTLERFCYSDLDRVYQRHVPLTKGIDERVWPQIRVYVTKAAQRAWDTDIQDLDGKLWFWPDIYLKMFQLTKPVISQRMIILDEAQDTNDCVWDIIKRQRGKQIILVGDSNQMIYEWRGSKDVMELLAEAESAKNVVKLMLTGSYRFGPEVAGYANLFLEALASDLRLKGYKKLDSVVTTERDTDYLPDAMIYRTNAGCIQGAMMGLESGLKVAIVGGGRAIEWIAEAARDLQQGRQTDHPELVGFENWEAVKTYCKEEPEDAGTLVPIVKAVDEYGWQAIIAMTKQLCKEEDAELTVTTAHKAKGREWDCVWVGEDFPVPVPDREPKKEELRLAYVTATRAKLRLVVPEEGLMGIVPEEKIAA